MVATQLPEFDFRTWSAAELADPYPIYRSYREQDPIHLVPAARRAEPATWYVFRHNDVAAVLSSPDFDRGMSSSPAPMVPSGYHTLRMIVENWLVFMDPPRHTRLRALVNKEFTPRVVAALRPRIEAIAADLISRMSGKPVVDLVEEFAAPFPILVVTELLGLPAHRWDYFREHVKNLREGIASRTARRADGYHLAEKSARELVAYFREEIDARRSSSRRDLLTLLIDAQQRGEPLTDDELIGSFIHLVIAGHETTTNLISKAVLAMLTHPEVGAELRSCPSLLPTAIEEFLRYDSPVQMVSRWARRDGKIGGRPVSAGDKVVLVIGSANRDPRRFTEPDALLIHRKDPRHCAFGGGIHFCLGAPLARLEAEIGLRLLLAAIELQQTSPPVCYAEDIVFHGPIALPLRTACQPRSAPRRGTT